jgi:acyl transferase domain-containing protein
MALACGVNLVLFPFSHRGFAGILSEDNRSKVFDSEANGFARAEAVGVLVLKRLSDAVKDGDRIHGMIRGFGMSQEGTSRSMGTPTVDGEALAMSLALEDANILPKDVQVVEAHGTGTSVGDPLEVLAIGKVYSTPEREQPLIITAGKANIGHTESASGIAGIIKTIMEMKHKMIPSQILIETLNPNIDLNKINAEILLAPKAWEPEGLRTAGINSFGITGTDTHLILQEAPQLPEADRKFGVMISPPQNLVTLSAKNEEALEELLALYINALEQDDLCLDDLAFSANTGRAHLSQRISVFGRNTKEILDKLVKRSYEGGTTPSLNTEEKPKICFLFTGQGSQFHGMGKVLYNTCPVFKVNFDKCEHILKSLYGLELKDALWGEDTSKLHNSLYSQSAIFVMEYCLVKLWESWGIVPDSVVGHSLGEFEAATTAGIISVEDALKLLGARCRLIDGLPKGKMIAVKANEKKTNELMTLFIMEKNDKSIWLDTAAINSSDQTTLSGTQEVNISKFIKLSIIEFNSLFFRR